MGAKNNKSDKGKSSATGPPAQDRFKTSQQLKQQIKDVQKVASGTAIQAGKKGQFLRDSQGNIVGYSGGAAKAKADAEKALRDTIASRIQAQEAKQVTPTQASITSVMDRMKQDRQNLLDRAKKNRITNTQLNQLGKLNRDLGFNRTTGMGVIESLRDQFTKPEFKQGIGNLVKAYQKISPMGLIMNKILNPQFEEETGIQSLPEFKGLQRSNQMFSPGVYDFTESTSMPMQFADASQSTIGIIQRMKDAGLSEDFAKDQFKGTEVTPEEVEGIYRGAITSPTGQYSLPVGMNRFEFDEQRRQVQDEINRPNFSYDFRTPIIDTPSGITPVNPFNPEEGVIISDPSVVAPNEVEIDPFTGELVPTVNLNPSPIFDI